MEIDHEIISTVILLSPADSRRVVVNTSVSMCTKYWLLFCQAKLRKNVSLGEVTDHPDMTIAVDWNVKNQTKPKTKTTLTTKFICTKRDVQLPILVSSLVCLWLIITYTPGET